MIKISQEEFEERVQDIIDGKTTRVKLLLDLRTDKITLNNKIQELVVYNPDLYKNFITKFPYVPRKYTHIDYEALIIDILKKGYTRREWDEVYEVSSRTILRNIVTLKQENPYLVNLYREVSKYRKRQKPLPEDLEMAINQLEEKDIYICGISDNKREALRTEGNEYIAKLQQGLKVSQASKEIGVNRFSKKMDTLNRIDIERQVIQEINSSKKEEKDDGGER